MVGRLESLGKERNASQADVYDQLEVVLRIEHTDRTQLDGTSG